MVLVPADLDPDIAEEGRYGFCAQCGCNVTSVSVDHGFGYEYWGYKAYHEDMRDCCPTCGDEVGEPRSEDEEA